MAGMRVLFFLGLVACYNPHLLPGAPCSEREPCPTGQACIAGVCGGPEGGGVDATPGIDAAAGADAALGNDATLSIADRDGDGVADASDNCPDVANPDQGNEDGDALGDACDPCPIDTNNADPDGDGVAGICDPHPTTPGDRILVFEGFHRGIPPTWQVDGTAVPSGDGVALTTAVDNHTALVPPIAAMANGTVMTNLVVDATVGGPDAAVTIALPYDPSQDQGIFCELYAPNAGSTSGRYVSLWDSPAQAERAKRNFAWSTATAYQVVLTRSGNNYACSVTASGGQPQTANSSTNSTTSQSKPTIATYGANAHVAWMLVVSSP
jgi:hypothetical protein